MFSIYFCVLFVYNIFISQLKLKKHLNIYLRVKMTIIVKTKNKEELQFSSSTGSYCSTKESKASCFLAKINKKKQLL